MKCTNPYARKMDTSDTGISMPSFNSFLLSINLQAPTRPTNHHNHTMPRSQNPQNKYPSPIPPPILSPHLPLQKKSAPNQTQHSPTPTQKPNRLPPFQHLNIPISSWARRGHSHGTSFLCTEIRGPGSEGDGGVGCVLAGRFWRALILDGRRFSGKCGIAVDMQVGNGIWDSNPDWILCVNGTYDPSKKAVLLQSKTPGSFECACGRWIWEIVPIYVH
jgi:hypothetical protein